MNLYLIVIITKAKKTAKRLSSYYMIIKNYFKSNRSKFITLVQAATKSFTNFS